MVLNETISVRKCTFNRVVLKGGSLKFKTLKNFLPLTVVFLLILLWPLITYILTFYKLLAGNPTVLYRHQSVRWCKSRLTGICFASYPEVFRSEKIFYFI